MLGFDKVLKCTFILMLAMATRLSAQVKSNNNNVWLHYVGKASVGKKLYVGLEASMRFTNYLGAKQQWFVRPFVDFKKNKNVIFTLGYSHYETYSYGKPPMFPITIPEDQLWIQTTLNHQHSRIKITHRIRNENRRVGLATMQNAGFIVDTYDYRNRMRYLLQAQIELGKKDHILLPGFYALLGNEMFLNIGKFSGKTLFNQNRVIAGLGMQFRANNHLQLVYIHQHIWNFGNTILESNPCIRLSYVHELNLQKSP